MKQLFNQGGQGSTGIMSNKQAIARRFGVKQSEVVYFSNGQTLDGFKVIYDKPSQRAYALPSNLGSVTATTLVDGLLTHSGGTVDLGALAVLREEFVTLVENFTSGFTIRVKNELVSDGQSLYRWGGALPNGVNAGSTVSNTGGVGPGKWLNVGDTVLRSDLNSANDGFGDDLIAVKHPSYNSVPRTQHDKNADLLSIQDLGAVSGVANAAVDDKVIAVLNDNAGLLIPAGFVYVTAKSITTLAGKIFSIVCPNGRATIRASGNYTMFTQPGQYKFERCLFENIHFEGNGVGNAASLFMSAADNEWTANFATYNCSWKGFYTVWNASWIAVYHYYPTFYSVNDNGYIVNTDMWSSGFAAFNLNRLDNPIFKDCRARVYFNLLGGFNFTINNPWLEKGEVFGDAFFRIRQFMNFKVIDGWFEYFKGKNFLRIISDGTEGTQSDLITFDGMHFNNTRTDSGFLGLTLMDATQFSENYTDTKFVHRNIFEHNNSTDGWYLMRAGNVVNRAENLTVLENLRLKPGQPLCSDGMSIARSVGGANPDIMRSQRRFSCSQFEVLPRAQQVTTYRTQAGTFQQQQIVDNTGNIAYWNIGSDTALVWGRDYVRPGRNNIQTCGTSTFAWSGGYTQTAFQITSDRDAKMDEEAINDAALDAWGEVQYITYRLKEQVAKKGEAARKHVGVIAQDIKAAFEKHGVDPFELGILCWEETEAQDELWGEHEDGTKFLVHAAIPEKSGFSVRYEELLCLEAAYMRREVAKVKSAIRGEV